MWKMLIVEKRRCQENNFTRFMGILIFSLQLGFFQITTIGRYGMSTTRCRIPLGMFYGHMVSLPGEDYSEPSDLQSSTSGDSESTVQATIDTQCSILSALAEDVQCRYVLCEDKIL